MNLKTFDHPRSLEGCGAWRHEGKCSLMQIMRDAQKYIEDLHFRIWQRLQQAGGRRRIRKGSAQTELTRRGLGGIP